MDVSVVVPFYNAERYIEDCILALVSQSFPADRYEIIMVDNNSTDGSAEIVRRYPRIRCLREMKQGSYAARNRGIAEARGSIIAFTDPDCTPHVGWLKNICEAMRDSEAGIIMGPRSFSIDSPLMSMLAAYESEMAACALTSGRKEVYFGYTNNMAVRRALFDRFGPFVEIDRGADNIFVRRIVGDYDAAIVRFAPQIRVRHLEIVGLGDYWRKKLVYGEVNSRNREIGAPQPLTRTERLDIFKKIVRERSCPPAQAIFLFLLLLVGALCFQLGRWRRFWPGRSEPQT